uniref:Uncharacterized protein n=1 Tax=Haptolina brevifila TaxID=156173 RepID=A0A7S2D484_9EUKA|mmetsp:Transcript_32625/g.64968  ORF Transcript_32625/g.64968 Transcript_32625/m.64968 type:complete len:113 (+) Transcript_32625:1-339(+)
MGGFSQCQSCDHGLGPGVTNGGCSGNCNDASECVVGARLDLSPPSMPPPPSPLPSSPTNGGEGGLRPCPTTPVDGQAANCQLSPSGRTARCSCQLLWDDGCEHPRTSELVCS